MRAYERTPFHSCVAKSIRSMRNGKNVGTATRKLTSQIAKPNTEPYSRSSQDRAESW
jgi:hypothetical protein